MRIDYEVELLLPAVTASLGVIGKDIDITIKRDKDGYPIFNAKHIKGILRERVYQFKRALGIEEKEIETFVNNYFGKEGNYIKNNDFNQVRFSNLTIKDKEVFKKREFSSRLVGNRYGIRINRKTKSTIPQSLFNYEFLVRNNVFIGSLDVNDSIENNDLKFILACLFHLDKIGGMKSRGIGKVRVKINGNYLEGENGVKATKSLDKIISELKRENNEKIELKEEKLIKYKYTLELEEAAVFKLSELGNYVKTRDSIQGSTIRGALIEYFHKKGANLEILKKIEASDAIREDNKISLASLFETKYPIKANNNKKVSIDKVINSDNEYEDGTKFERASVSELKVDRNEISVKINTKVKSAENGMLFNAEYISNIENSKNIILVGDLKLPKEITENKFTIYIGKYRFKGFGKATIIIEKYSDKTEKDIIDRINELSAKVQKDIKSKIGKEKEKDIKDEIDDKDKKTICFDLYSDMIIPFTDIYDAGEQFLILADLKNENIKFNPKRSFINTGKLEGFNIINGIRKVDELIFVKGSVFTYTIEENDHIKFKEKLIKIEENGLGLRKNEGFGRIRICTERGDKYELPCKKRG
ncbi:RAMP superfamily CRISPR-associated protein [Fusobacterium pseudoperiodonticum]|jgi:hypothetical protein|uniref:CRISPR type III-associated protein domain-containing protein n=1 Tax=Fusobacterium pseudoperiodonticum TaxID=2663009 RepID=A0A2D3PVJ1_9FUSO|nr:RAMP superfamily CRISPR-associated protein [Fusobacterium pseudoperiodonticum]ATV70844.1 hypothetical protein CTM98_09420 [Fusobacterium pseudoperiodonticum]